MYTEEVVLESRALRSNLGARTDVLDRVKALRLLPDGVHVTRSMVAVYYEVSEEALRSVIRRHREELAESGYTVLKGSDLHEFLWVNLTHRTKVPGTGLGIFAKRAVLNVGMLLRDSEVARAVRRYLLDAEAELSFDSIGASFGSSLRATVSQAVDQALVPHTRLIAAMSNRLCDVQQEVKELRDFGRQPQSAVPKQRRRSRT